MYRIFVVEDDEIIARSVIWRVGIIRLHVQRIFPLYWRNF